MIYWRKYLMSQSRKVIDALSYKISPNDKFFVDSSVFLPFLDANYDRDDKSKELQRKAQSLFKNIIAKHAKIYILPELLSECYNRYIHNLHEIAGGKEIIDYKAYRKTEECKQFVESFKLQLSQLLEEKVVEFDSFKLETEDIDDFFKIFNKIDFNDYLFMKYAKSKGLIFITNDKDFSISFDNLKLVLSLNKTLIGRPY